MTDHHDGKKVRGLGELGLGLHKRARIPPPPPPSPEAPPPLPPRPVSYDNRPVIKLDLPEPPDDESMPPLDLEQGEYLLKEEIGSPRFQVMSPSSESTTKAKSESSEEDDVEPIPFADFLKESSLPENRPSTPVSLSFLPNSSKTPEFLHDYPDVWPPESPLFQQNTSQIEVELVELNQQKIDDLTKKIEQFKLELDGHDLKKLEEDKRIYVNNKLNPTEPKEKERLAHRLRIYAYQNLDEQQRKQAVENKIAHLQAEFEREFEESLFLRHTESNVIEAYTDLNFKKTDPSLWTYVFSGLNKSIDEARNNTLESRRKFKEQNRDIALLEALRASIRDTLTSEERLELDCTESLQADMDKREYKTRVSQLPTYQTISDAKIAKKQARPVINQLCKEQQNLRAERNPAPLLAVLDDQRRSDLLFQFRTTLASQRTKNRTGVVAPDTGAYVVLDAYTKKPFRSLAAKSK